MPNAVGTQGDQWDNCQRCGFLYPLGQLRRQNGLILCTRTCTDDLSIMYRPLQIQQILAQIGEGTDRRSVTFKDPGELVEF